MPEPNPTQDFNRDLLARLGLQPGGPDRAYGEIQGSPQVGKVLVLGGIALGCYFGASTQKKVGLRL